MTLSAVDSFIFAQRDANGNVISLVAATSDSGYVLDTRSGGTGSSANDIIFRVSAVGGLTAATGVDADGVSRIDISGAPVPALTNASALQGSAIGTTTAITNDVLTWNGSQWIPQSVAGATNSIDFSAVHLLGTTTGDASVGASAVGDKFYLSAGPNISFTVVSSTQTIGISGAAGVAATPTFDYSAVYLTGTTTGDPLIGASGVGAGFTLSAGPNIAFVGNNTTKVVSISSTEPGAAVASYDFSSISSSGTGATGSYSATTAGDSFNFSGGPNIQVVIAGKTIGISGIDPGSLANTSDFSAINTSGTASTGSYASSGPGDSFNFSAGSNMKIVIAGKTVGFSSAPTGNAVTLQGSAISTVTATNGQVLAWSGSGNTWAPSSVLLASSFGAIGKVGNQLATPTGTTILATTPGDSFSISAGGNIYVAFDSALKRIVLSGAPGSASSLQGSAISTAVAITGDVLAWDGGQWIHSGITHPTPPPSGTYAAASSISLSAINTTPIAAQGDVFAWGPTGWQASTLTHPAGSSPTFDYSAVYLAGTLGGGTLVGASGFGAGFTLSAGPNIKIVGSDTTKVIGLSSAPTGNAVTLQGSAISTDTATHGQVLSWASATDAWSPSSILLASSFGAIGKLGNLLADPTGTTILAVTPGDSFSISADGNIYIGFDSALKRMVLSGGPNTASSLQGSAISTDTAITGDVLAWDGGQWIHSGVTYPTPPPSGTYAAASSISLSAINTTPVAGIGDVFAWGSTGWQASTLTHPAPGSNATTLQGSAISTVTATQGQVLTWSSTGNAWVASSIIGGGGGIGSVVEDPTPVLGGNLDTNGLNISSFAGANSTLRLSHVSATNLSAINSSATDVRGFLVSSTHLSAIDLSSVRVRSSNVSATDMSSIRIRATNVSSTEASARELFVSAIRAHPAGSTGVLLTSDNTGQARLNFAVSGGGIIGTVLAANSALQLSGTNNVTVLSNLTVTGTDLAIRGFSGSTRHLRVGNSDLDAIDSGTPIPMHWIEIKNTSATPLTNTSAIFGSIPTTTVYASNDSYSSTYDMNNLGDPTVNITVKRAGYYKVEAFGSVAVTANTIHTFTIVANETSSVQTNRTGGSVSTDPNAYAISTFLYFDVDDAISFLKKSSVNAQYDRYCTFTLTYYGPIIT